MHTFRRSAGTIARQASNVASSIAEASGSDCAAARIAVAQREQARFIALAQPDVSAQSAHQEAVAQRLAPLPHPADRDSDHARRVAEMERAAVGRSRPLPSPEQVAERLRSHQGASCSTGTSDQPQQHGTAQPGLQWQDIVAALRQGGLEPARGPQILTDTFRCVRCKSDAFTGTSQEAAQPTKC